MPYLTNEKSFKSPGPGAYEVKSTLSKKSIKLSDKLNNSMC